MSGPSSESESPPCPEANDFGVLVACLGVLGLNLPDEREEDPVTDALPRRVRRCRCRCRCGWR